MRFKMSVNLTISIRFNVLLLILYMYGTFMYEYLRYIYCTYEADIDKIYNLLCTSIELFTQKYNSMVILNIFEVYCDDNRINLLNYFGNI